MDWTPEKRNKEKKKKKKKKKEKKRKISTLEIQCAMNISQLKMFKCFRK